MVAQRIFWPLVYYCLIELAGLTFVVGLRVGPIVGGVRQPSFGALAAGISLEVAGLTVPESGVVDAGGNGRRGVAFE